MRPLFVFNFIVKPLFVHAPDIIVFLKFLLGILSLIKYVDIVKLIINNNV